MIEVVDLTYYYKKSSDGLKNVSLTFPKEKITGVIGANGSGKSTLFKLMTGYLGTPSGKFFINGSDITSNLIGSKSKISLCLDSPSVFKALTVSENMEYYNILFKKSPEFIAEILEMLNLTQYKDYPAKKLSFGLTQRLNIATSLLRDADVLIFDEPLNGLDPQSITILREMFLQYKNKKKTLIVSAHLLSEIEKIADIIIILKEGKVVFQQSNPHKDNRQYFMIEIENTPENKEYLSGLGDFAESKNKLRICTPDLVNLERGKVVGQTQNIENIYNFLYEI